MPDVMNIGVRALLVNQSALQTVGNNIANVNTPGYSRQSVVLKSVAGQFSGTGYYGKGVAIETVQRNYSEFLTQQAALSKSVAAGDTIRYNNLSQLENIFQGGSDGLGASISNMLNAFSDVVNAPTDLTARSVVLTQADETAARLRTAAGQLNDLKLGAMAQLKTDVTTINNLAQQIASANDQVTKALGSGHTPNDLLDQRDQLINQLNHYVQTTSISADDGSVGIFLSGSQPLVLGTAVSPLKVVSDAFNDPAKSQLMMTVSGVPLSLNATQLGGGEISGLLRFQNTDLVEAGNLLGRMALAIGSKMNEQQALGLDLNGNPGTPLFNLKPIPNGYPASTNALPGTALSVGVQTSPSSGAALLVASNYELSFSSATTGSITRLSDGVVTAFDFGASNPVKIDGLDIQKSAVAATAGDRFLITPFSAAAPGMATAFSSPRGLAMANPVAARAGTGNTGTLVVDGLAARSQPAPPAVTLTFTGPGSYTRSDTGATVYAYTPNQAIEYSTSGSLTGWSLTLKGVPQAGDTYAVQPNTYPTLDAGNAQAMLDLRDLALFDGGPLTDGYASLMASIGTRVQSAKTTMTVSVNIATQLETDRTSVSGVNLDEEAAKLLQFQQAYQAAGKMLQISQSIFDTLMQNLGR